MYRLKNRNKPLPNGVTWRDPGTGWQSPAFTSFDEQVKQITQARVGNPGMARRYRLSTDPSEVANELDSNLGRLAFENGWTDYYVSGIQERSAGGAPAPFPPRPKSHGSPNLAGLVAGAKTLAEMFGQAGPVEKELAETRASVCVTCPVHEKADGDWIFKLFTSPAANAVRQMLSVIKGENLETSHDINLAVCGACGCPVKTKVHAQLDHILKHMPQEAKDALWDKCWIRTLDGKSEPPPSE
jgi:hypothetical protein